MASKTEIANRGLMKLGQPRVSNIDTDPSPAAVAMSALFDSVRDELLQSYPWNFAIKRVDIAAAVDTPSWGWNNAFPLPSDCMRIIEIKDLDEYAIESVNDVTSIVCDEAGPLYVKYIYRVTDPGLFTSLFNELMSSSLAIEACSRITDDDSLKQLLLGQHNEIMNRVTSTDAIENPVEYFVEDDWLSARE